MNTHNQRGFTIIELMVALVVGGLLMAALVALSGSVQRSFGFTKDISEVQTNLRFTMKTLVDDLGRVGFMTDPDPSRSVHPGTNCQLPSSQPAMAFSNGEMILRGNYTSARDYKLEVQPSLIVCRNEVRYNPSLPNSENCGGYEEYFVPLRDGPDRLDDIFCTGIPVRMDTGDRTYCYFNVESVIHDTMSVTLNPAVSQDYIPGTHHFINPINVVNYQVVADNRYPAHYANPTSDATRWVLQRTFTGCNAGQLAVGNPVEVGAFLLDPDGPRPGWEFEFYEDTSANLSLASPMPGWQPVIVGPTPLDWANPPLFPERLRAVVVTLRARTEFEDPNFVIPNYTPDQDIGVDLDNNPANGLAHVRVERTVVQLRNLGLNLSI